MTSATAPGYPIIRSATISVLALLSLPSTLGLTVPVPLGSVTSLCGPNTADACEDLDTAGETVLAVYVDEATGNSAKLIARDEGLFCAWEAEKNIHADVGFIPEYYMVECFINKPGSDLRLGKNSNRAPAAGDDLILDFVPKRNIQWTIIVTAVEVITISKTTNTVITETSDEWWLEGELGGEKTAKVHFLGNIPIPELGVKLSAGVSGGYKSTTKTTVVNTTEYTVQERHAMMLGGQVYVSLVPNVNVEWTGGQSRGCDGLDVVEMLVGEREIGTHQITMESQGSTTGAMTTNYEASEHVRVVDLGAFDGVLDDPHGFKAHFDQEGTNFVSAITFEVDYEHPEGVFTGLIDFPGTEYFLHFDAGGGGQDNGGFVVNLLETNIPATEFSSVATIITAADLEANELSLGRTVSRNLLNNHDLVRRALIPTGCGGDLLAPKDFQEWSAVGAIAGVGVGAEAARLKPVEVVLDLGYGGYV